MNILIITPYIPFPLSEGGKISQYAIIDYLRKNNKLSLVVINSNAEDEANVKELRLRWPDVEISAIEINTEQEYLPLQKARLKFLFQKITNSVHKLQLLFLPARSTHKCKVSEIDNESFVNILRVKNREFINHLTRIIDVSRPDIIQVDIIDYIDLVFALPSNLKKVFVHHEIRFARLQSLIDTGTIITSNYDRYALNLAKQQELMFLNKYDGVAVFSEEDQMKIKRELPDLDVFVSPFPVLEEYFQPITKQNVHIDKLVFVGGENHAPNKDAIEWYLEAIGHHINKKQRLTLHVVGYWSEETKERYKNNTLIHFTGFVEDLIAYCNNSIMLVPVRIGSGIRTKILYAMAQGVPVVSTSLGCEGIKVKDQESILIANSPEQFSLSVIKLIQDPDFVIQVTEAAQKSVRINYSQEAAGELRISYYTKLLQAKKNA